MATGRIRKWILTFLIRFLRFEIFWKRCNEREKMGGSISERALDKELLQQEVERWRIRI